ncbi:hypothetical protein LTR36_003662 [Oleoguttula mirabilis]|uniref:Tryptophan synthase beta chain-like PALP domain-containing protein n=1 Tax=Oleoguttula mirabilis TaxID=1507867 RepID=A0AAV9JIU6_9PEZI|nr:hypothetical protein LTR36_003662 [Oleoguttula mirabilis]
MSSYTITHLNTGETFTRPSALVNPHYDLSRDWQLDIDSAVEAFHKQLPDYGETTLHSLPSVAAELGFAHVFIKDESTRFGLPSFKILGASWAVHRAVCQRLNLPNSTSLAELQAALKHAGGETRLVTCTDGNWGRACARMAKHLDIPIKIYVPAFMVEYTQNLLREEGADVKVVANGTYDDAIVAAQQDAEKTGALMVMDTSWAGYEEVPGWVTEGYSTMLRETDRQVAALTSGRKPEFVVGSVGVGSWMHAVTSHYKAVSPTNKVVTVEPDRAACLKESLHTGQMTSIKTGDTIMCGMNCGTPSKIAWSVLRDGVDVAVTVTDKQSHECVQYLQSQGVNAGPCGAATLAALRRACTEPMVEKRGDGVVVLFSTEGMREYDVPV